MSLLPITRFVDQNLRSVLCINHSGSSIKALYLFGNYRYVSVRSILVLSHLSYVYVFVHTVPNIMDIVNGLVVANRCDRRRDRQTQWPL